MCGIVGYAGQKAAAGFLMAGLRKLEYRGYDSAGMTTASEDGLKTVKCSGKLQALQDRLGADWPGGAVGIGHTRWATHGAPNDQNAHPQVSQRGRFAVVHNGIIENYLELKTGMQCGGVRFASETDTEVVVQLLEQNYEGDVLQTLRKVLPMLQGSYALGILCADTPERIYAARKDSPLVLGIGVEANFLASDIPAILSETREICRLRDGELAVLTAQEVHIFDMQLEPVKIRPEYIDWDASAAEKGGYPHFMLKEILEQPKILRDTILPHIRGDQVILEEIFELAQQMHNVHRICIAACGTAYHAGLMAKYTLESMLRIPVEVDTASEFRYRNPVLDENTLVILISQSGETADTLAALREAKRRGCRTLSIVNVVGSSIAAESDHVLYTHAGPEISVASTKAYSAQLAMLALLGLYLGEYRGTIPKEAYQKAVRALQHLPEQTEALLEQRDQIRQMAESFCQASDVYFIGRGVDHVSAMEAALKLKEISYIHAEAYPAGELKHGPIALIGNGTPVIALASEPALFGKMMSNIREVKARGAAVLGITTEGRMEMESEAAAVFYLPETESFLRASLAAIPIQLFAYYMASLRGCEIDQPRNLAKSVTVE